MASKIGNDLDFSKYQAYNLALHRLSVAPSSPALGQLYYDTDDNIPYVYTGGGGWLAMIQSAGAAPTGPAGGSLSGSYPDPGIAAGAVGTTELAANAVTNAKVSTTAAIALSKLATDPLARANHTGTQLASTISDFDTQVRTSRLDQMAAPTGSVTMNSQKITSLLTPTAANDAANKAYVDAVAQGLDFKTSVVAASATNVSLASAVENGDTLDGVTLATGDRIGLFGQTTGSENGLYTVNASGAPTRATDADANGEISKGSLVFVEGGTANGGQLWVCIATGATPWVPGSSTSTWSLYFAATATQAGAGLTATSNVFAVGQGTGIVVNANDVAIDTSVVVRKYAANVGDNSSTSFVLTHNLGTRNVQVQVYTNGSPWDQVLTDNERTDANNVTVRFGTAPATNAYTVVIQG